MRKLIPYITAMMAVSLMFVVGCSGNRNKTSSNRTGMSNSDVEKRIQDRFKADPQLNAFDIKVSADSDDNEVKLSGTVNSEDARKRAVQIAQGVLPGFSISDTIDVKPRELARSDEDNANQSGTGNQNYNQNQRDMNQRDLNQNQRDLNQRDLNNQNQAPAR
jgi:hypothetical protein